MKSTEIYLSFGAGIDEACGILELEFLKFFSSLTSNFLSFDLMIWVRYVLVMFIGLNWLKYDDLVSKRRNLGFKQSVKVQKDPWKSCYQAKWRTGVTVRRLPDTQSLGPSSVPVWQSITKMRHLILLYICG